VQVKPISHSIAANRPDEANAIDDLCHKRRAAGSIPNQPELLRALQHTSTVVIESDEAVAILDSPLNVVLGQWPYDLCIFKLDEDELSR